MLVICIRRSTKGSVYGGKLPCMQTWNDPVCELQAGESKLQKLNLQPFRPLSPALSRISAQNQRLQSISLQGQAIQRIVELKEKFELYPKLLSRTEKIAKRLLSGIFPHLAYGRTILNTHGRPHYAETRPPMTSLESLHAIEGLKRIRCLSLGTSRHLP